MDITSPSSLFHVATVVPTDAGMPGERVALWPFTTLVGSACQPLCSQASLHLNPGHHDA